MFILSFIPSLYFASIPHFSFSNSFHLLSPFFSNLFIFLFFYFSTSSLSFHFYIIDIFATHSLFFSPSLHFIPIPSVFFYSWLFVPCLSSFQLLSLSLKPFPFIPVSPSFPLLSPFFIILYPSFYSLTHTKLLSLSTFFNFPLSSVFYPFYFLHFNSFFFISFLLHSLKFILLSFLYILLLLTIFLLLFILFFFSFTTSCSLHSNPLIFSTFPPIYSSFSLIFFSLSHFPSFALSLYFISSPYYFSLFSSFSPFILFAHLVCTNSSSNYLPLLLFSFTIPFCSSPSISFLLPFPLSRPSLLSFLQLFIFSCSTSYFFLLFTFVLFFSIFISHLLPPYFIFTFIFSLIFLFPFILPLFLSILSSFPYFTSSPFSLLPFHSQFFLPLLSISSILSLLLFHSLLLYLSIPPFIFPRSPPHNFSFYLLSPSFNSALNFLFLTFPRLSFYPLLPSYNFSLSSVHLFTHTLPSTSLTYISMFFNIYPSWYLFHLFRSPSIFHHFFLLFIIPSILC